MGARDYLEGGGEGEYTVRRNRAAFDGVELMPRVLHDVSHVDTRTSALGCALPLPIVLSPVGGPRMFHHEGELAVARAADHTGIPYAISTLATTPVEAVGRRPRAAVVPALRLGRPRRGQGGARPCACRRMPRAAAERRYRRSLARRQQ